MIQRIIKFRAWNTYEKKMEYNFRIYWDAVNFDDVLKNYQEHTPLMQFTGLVDKAGQEIYEGDIVKHWHPARVEEVGEVKFATEYYAAWYLKPVKSHEVLMGGTESKYEVIGNVYEHPTLISHPLT